MKIIHIEDHPLFSEGLSTLLLSAQQDIQCQQASTYQQAKHLLEAGDEADLILMDIFMPEMNGIQMIRKIRSEGILSPIAVLSASSDLMDIKQALDEGAMGFIPKALPSNEIIKAIQSIIQGEIFLTPEHKKVIKQLPQHSRDDVARKYALSYKQLEVLDKASLGFSNLEIANALGISESAVKYHMTILFQSFAVKNRVECLRYAESIGLVRS
jgi:DNA-binding NarL/FixJ family response regulator